MPDIEDYEPLWGAWYVESSIGEGAFGQVYKVRREDFDKTYYSAVKIISIPLDSIEIKQMRTEGLSDDSIRDFYYALAKDILNEITLMSELRGNSHVVSIEDHQIIRHEDGIGWDILLRMELLTSFSDYVAEHTLTEADVIKAGIHICRALELCALNKVIHRDLKPDNIFVSAYGDFKLGDFGIARNIERTMSGMSRKGSYTTMAPEVFQGKKYGTTVDAYALGIVMYTLLNQNRAPFLPDYPQPIMPADRDNALEKRMNGEILPPLNNVSPMLNAAVLKACAYDRKDRFDTPTEMRQALEALTDSNKPDSSNKQAGTTRKDWWQQKNRPIPFLSDGSLPASDEKIDEKADEKAAKTGTPGKAAGKSPETAQPPKTLLKKNKFSITKNRKKLILASCAAAAFLVLVTGGWLILRNFNLPLPLGDLFSQTDDSASLSGEPGGTTETDHTEDEMTSSDTQDTDNTGNTEDAPGTSQADFSPITGAQGTRPFIVWSSGSLHLSYWTGSAWQHDQSGFAVKSGSHPSAFAGAGGTQWIAWVDSTSVLRLSHWSGSDWQHDNFGRAVVMAADTSPSAFKGPGSHPHIAWVDSASTLRLSSWTGSAWQHDTFSGLSVRAGSSPSACANAGGLRWIAWIDPAGILRLSHWTGSAWQHDNFGMATAAGTSPSAFSGPGNNPNIAWVDAGGKLRLSHWNGSAWQHDTLSDTSARSGSSPSAYAGPDNSRWIAWIDNSGILRLSHWTGSAWQHDNFGVAGAAGSNPSAFNGPGNQPHIAWVDATGTLRLSHWNGSAWQHDNLGFLLPAGAHPSAYLG